MSAAPATWCWRCWPSPARPGPTGATAAALANTAAGLEVEKFGSVPITPREILHELLSEAHHHLGKQRTLETLLPELPATAPPAARSSSPTAAST
jgi:hypothetical protein